MTFTEYFPYTEHCGRLHEEVRALLQEPMISDLCADQLLPEENPKLAPFCLFVSGFISFHSVPFHFICGGGGG